MSGDHTFWYLSRAAGMVSYVLLFASVVLGLLLTGGEVERWLRRYRIYDLHRFLALLTLGMIVFHVLIVLPDSYFRFTLPQLVLPFASPYRPIFAALGVLGLYLTAVIVLSFYLRAIVPYSAWRLLHYTTFAAFVLALAHGVGAGTDTADAWARWLYAASGAIVFNLLVLRLVFGHARPGIENRMPKASERTGTSAVVERAGN